MLSTSKSLFRNPTGGGPGPTPVDATFGYVPLLLETGSSSSLNTTVTDSSASPNTVTRVSNPSTGWVSPYQTDGYWGNQFNGTNASLSAARQSAMLLGTNNFTIEFWVYFNSVAIGQTVAGSHVTTAAGDWLIYTKSAGTLAYYLSSTGATWNIANQVDIGSVVTGVWYHVALVRNGSVFTPYLNGVAGTTTTSSASLFASSAPVTVAAANNSLTYFNGYVSNFRMANGVAVYSGSSTGAPNFTLPTSPLTKVQSANANGNPSAAITGSQTALLICQSNRFIDNSNNTFPLTTAGTPQVTPYFYPSGFTAPAASPGAALFNGTNQYLTVPSSSAFYISSGQFTIEAWIYRFTTGQQILISQAQNNGAPYDGWHLRVTASGTLAFEGSNGATLTGGTVLPLNTWVHVAVVRVTSSITLYVNGNSDGTGSPGIVNYAGTLAIGQYTFPAGANYFNGYISNLRFVKGAAVYTGNFTPPTLAFLQTSGAASAASYISTTNVNTSFAASNTSLLLNLADSNYNSATNGVQNNTFIDSSNYAFPITRNGTPTQGSITPYWPNGQWSNYFSGTGQYLSSSNATTVLQFGSNPYTIEGWVYQNARSTTQWICGGTFSGTGYQFGINSSGFIFGSVPGVGDLTAATTAISLNTWTHFAIVRTSTSSGGVAYYINGAAAGTATDSSNISGTATSLNIATTNNNTSVSPLNGYLSNFRIVKGRAVYSGTFTPSTVPLTATTGGTNPPTGTQTAILTCQSNRFLDTSAQVTPATLTPTGTPTVQAFQPFSPTASYTTALYGGSGYFNGSTDYLSITDGTALKLGSGNFTIEGWVYLSSSGGSQAIYARSGFGIIIGVNSGNFVLVASSNGSSFDLANGITFGAAVANTWIHFAAVRNGANITLYLNGVLGNTVAVSTSTLYEATAPTVGNWNYGGANWWLNGYASNLRVVKGTAVYTGVFTPPTLAPLATTGPASAASYSSTTNVNTTFLTPASLLLNMTNAGIYDAAVQNNAITVGNAQVSTAQSKWSPTSMAFDGSGDYLRILPVPPSLTLGTSNFTIDGWVYFNTVAGAQTIFDQRPASTNGAYPVIYMNGATMVWYVNTAGQITSSALSTGVWYYFAVTRSASVTRMYINGAQVGSDYADTNNYLASGTLIGVTSDIASGLNGYLQDFRITRGVARTIATPTAAFPTR